MHRISFDSEEGLNWDKKLLGLLCWLWISECFLLPTSGRVALTSIVEQQTRLGNKLWIIQAAGCCSPGIWKCFCGSKSMSVPNKIGFWVKTTVSDEFCSVLAACGGLFSLECCVWCGRILSYSGGQHSYSVTWAASITSRHHQPGILFIRCPLTLWCRSHFSSCLDSFVTLQCRFCVISFIEEYWNFKINVTDI